MKKIQLSATALKLIAILAMFFDHAAGAFISHDTLWGMALRIPLFIFAAIPLLALYSGKKGGSKLISQVFYWFYPGHLLLLYLLQIRFPKS